MMGMEARMAGFITTTRYDDIGPLHPFFTLLTLCLFAKF